MKKKSFIVILAVAAMVTAGCGASEPKEDAAEKKISELEEKVAALEVEKEENKEEVNEEKDTSDQKEKEPEDEKDHKDGKVPENKDSSEAAGDWKTLSFTLDGEPVQFPITYADVKAMGFQVEAEYEAEAVKAQTYTTSLEAQKDNGVKIDVRFKNFTDTDKTVKDSDIYGFRIENSAYEEVNPEFTFCNGITFGDSVQSVKDLMGEPGYVYESDDGDRHVLDYYTNGESFGSKVSFTFHEDKMSGVEIVNAD